MYVLPLPILAHEVNIPTSCHWLNYLINLVIIDIWFIYRPRYHNNKRFFLVLNDVWQIHCYYHNQTPFNFPWILIFFSNGQISRGHLSSIDGFRARGHRETLARGHIGQWSMTWAKPHRKLWLVKACPLLVISTKPHQIIPINEVHDLQSNYKWHSVLLIWNTN